MVQPENVGGRRDLRTPTAAIFNAHVRDNLNFLYGAPACRVYNSANESILDSTATALTFNSERFDNDTMHSTSSNTERVTATTAGRYLFIGNSAFAANATGTRLSQITHSVGPTDIAREWLPITGAASTTVLNVATIQAMAAAEYMTLQAWQTSGGALNVLSSANYSPEFMAHWMGN